MCDQDEGVHWRTWKDRPVDSRTGQEEQSMGREGQMYHYVTRQRDSRIFLQSFFFNSLRMQSKVITLFLPKEDDKGRNLSSYRSHMNLKQKIKSSISFLPSSIIFTFRRLALLLNASPEKKKTSAILKCYESNCRCLLIVSRLVSCVRFWLDWNRNFVLSFVCALVRIFGEKII